MQFSKRSAADMKKQLGVEDRGPNAIDLCIDASGAEVSIQTAIAIVKTGGTYVQVIYQRIRVASPQGLNELFLFSGWNGTPGSDD